MQANHSARCSVQRPVLNSFNPAYLFLPCQKLCCVFEELQENVIIRSTLCVCAQTVNSFNFHRHRHGLTANLFENQIGVRCASVECVQCNSCLLRVNQTILISADVFQTNSIAHTHRLSFCSNSQDGFSAKLN